MDEKILAQYKRNRLAEYHISPYTGKVTVFCQTAESSLRNARYKIETQRLWDEAGENVRLDIEPDNMADLDNVLGDTFNPAANPDIPPARLEKEKADEIERINRDGIVGIVGMYFDGESWQTADSVWGFIGDDWRESGYDLDIMRATVEAYNKVGHCPACGWPIPSAK